MKINWMIFNKGINRQGFVWKLKQNGVLGVEENAIVLCCVEQWDGVRIQFSHGGSFATNKFMSIAMI